MMITDLKIIQVLVLAAMVIFSHQEEKVIDLPGPEEFCISAAIRIIYKEVPVNFNIRIAQGRWEKSQLEIGYIPNNQQVNQLLYKVYEPDEANNFAYCDFFQAVKVSHIYALFSIIKYFGIMDAGFVNRAYILKGVYNFADFMNNEDKEFNLGVKFKDEIGMKINFKIDKEKVKKYIEESKMIEDEDNPDNLFNKEIKTKQFNEGIIENEVLDYRKMIKSIPKFQEVIDLNTFVDHTKRFFGMMNDRFFTSQGQLSGSLGSNINTGFMKTVEDSVIDDIITDVSKFSENATFAKFESLADIELSLNAEDYDIEEVK